MLVIDRRDQERLKFFINDVEFVIIVALEKGKAKLVIDAPRVVEVWRMELLTNGERPTK